MLCFLERCVGELPAAQQKIHEGKIKTADNSHSTTQMK
jgi:hypothetical protein